jgi:hypothetical protein
VDSHMLPSESYQECEIREGGITPPRGGSVPA